MSKINHYLKEKLEARKAENALRTLSVALEKIDFATNDYLGLAKNKTIQNRTNELAKNSYSGATGSRLISGQSELYNQTEKLLSQFYKAKSSLVFNSGYAANTGLLSCIATRHDTILYDQLIHASLRDGIRLSSAKSFAFRHNDLEHLTERLKAAKGNIFVVSESLFSMNGNYGKVKEIYKISKKFNAALIIDEAHSTGVYGTHGEGYCAELGLTDEIFARIFTFGKAMGGHGAVICGSKDLRNFLINFSRPFIYTTALPPHTLAHIHVSHEFLLEKNNLKEKLFANIQFFRDLARDKNIDILPSESAIQGVLISDNTAVKKKAEQLQKADFFVKPILHPTVEKGKERIRLCMHSYNTSKEIADLVELLRG